MVKSTTIFLTLLLMMMQTIPSISIGEEVNLEGWPVPDLRNLIPYSISIKKVDGAEKVVEKFHTLNGGHVARISGNGKVFAYAVDKNREPPIDYLLLDMDGSGRFTKRLKTDDIFIIPEWVFH